MRTPETRYARNGKASIAYQVLGQASIDLMVLPGFVSNLEIQWDDPDFDQWARHLSTFARLILMDQRGTGLSDRAVPTSPDADDQSVQDICAVLDATGCGRVALCGGFDSAFTVLRFAARFPDRVRALICYAPSTVHSSEILARIIEKSWGCGDTARVLAPGQAQDARFRARWARFERLSASPSEAAILMRSHHPIIEPALFSNLAVPALFLHRTGDAFVPQDQTRKLARTISGAEFAVLPGQDHLIWTGGGRDLAESIQTFLTGTSSKLGSNDVVATLLASRVPNMERVALKFGESRWVSRIQRFRDASEDIVSSNAGHCLASDFATCNAVFDSSAMAIRTALALQEIARSLDLPLAAGLHLGEISRESDPGASRAFLIASEIARTACPDELVASRLVVDVVNGMGLRVTNREPLMFDGMKGPIHLVRIAMEPHLEPAHPPSHDPDLSVLSARECDVLRLIAAGLSNAAIASELRLSIHTVKRHVSNILMKLDLPTRVSVAVLAEHLSP